MEIKSENWYLMEDNGDGTTTLTMHFDGDDDTMIIHRPLMEMILEHASEEEMNKLEGITTIIPNSAEDV